jgi:hypothetical protein
MPRHLREPATYDGGVAAPKATARQGRITASIHHLHVSADRCVLMWTTPHSRQHGNLVFTLSHLRTDTCPMTISTPTRLTNSMYSIYFKIHHINFFMTRSIAPWGSSGPLSRRPSRELFALRALLRAGCFGSPHSSGPVSSLCTGVRAVCRSHPASLVPHLSR